MEPKIEKIMGVYMLCFPGGICAEIDPNDPRVATAIDQLERQEAVENAMSMRTIVDNGIVGRFEPF